MRPRRSRARRCANFTPRDSALRGPGAGFPTALPQPRTAKIGGHAATFTIE
jgi:hypothetical protein